MKYIRTKYGIFEVIIKEKFGYKVKTNKPIILPIPFESVIKQTNNIKELCDDFIVCHPEVNGGLPFILPKRDGLLENEFKLAVYCKTFPYGAVWTDKGLIYVAKLNEKGEWELL